mmetsp:Transcript_76163/g.217535  ORF Transcript_76163/g.217535 Transcript_76163/m.217535 type:complete len:260 (+) Transcript_76163:235-1014(+)
MTTVPAEAQRQGLEDVIRLVDERLSRSGCWGVVSQSLRRVDTFDNHPHRPTCRSTSSFDAASYVTYCVSRSDAHAQLAELAVADSRAALDAAAAVLEAEERQEAEAREEKAEVEAGAATEGGGEGSAAGPPSSPKRGPMVVLETADERRDRLATRQLAADTLAAEHEQVALGHLSKAVESYEAAVTRSGEVDVGMRLQVAVGLCSLYQRAAAAAGVEKRDTRAQDLAQRTYVELQSQREGIDFDGSDGVYLNLLRQLAR